MWCLTRTEHLQSASVPWLWNCKVHSNHILAPPSRHTLALSTAKRAISGGVGEGKKKRNFGRSGAEVRLWCAWREKSTRTVMSCLYIIRRVHDSCIDAKLSKTERKIWEVRKTANEVRIQMILTETEFFWCVDKFLGLICAWLWRCRFSCHFWVCHSCHWCLKTEELHHVGLLRSCGRTDKIRSPEKTRWFEMLKTLGSHG